MRLKLMAFGLFLIFLLLFYLWSIYIAYNRGYNKKASEVEHQVVQVVVGSHSDILEAAKEVQEDEKNIKYTPDCNLIWNFDLHQCLLK